MAVMIPMSLATAKYAVWMFGVDFVNGEVSWGTGSATGIRSERKSLASSPACADSSVAPPAAGPKAVVHVVAAIARIEQARP
jgi:hypothetical protein